MSQKDYALVHSYVWSNGQLEFNSDLDLESYIVENGPNGIPGGNEFTRIAKITVEAI